MVTSLASLLASFNPAETLAAKAYPRDVEDQGEGGVKYCLGPRLALPESPHLLLVTPGAGCWEAPLDGCPPGLRKGSPSGSHDYMAAKQTD